MLGNGVLSKNQPTNLFFKYFSRINCRVHGKQCSFIIVAFFVCILINPKKPRAHNDDAYNSFLVLRANTRLIPQLSESRPPLHPKTPFNFHLNLKKIILFFLIEDFLCTHSPTLKKDSEGNTFRRVLVKEDTRSVTVNLFVFIFRKYFYKIIFLCTYIYK